MIIIGADHAGYKLKEEIKKFLLSKKIELEDIGAEKIDNSDDFSHFVKLISTTFDKYLDSYYEDKDYKIIAVCGSGVGMNIGLNKHKNIKCVLGHSVEEVEIARKHNNVNALALAGRTTKISSAKKMVMTFLNTKNLNDEKYIRRMKSIEIK